MNAKNTKFVRRLIILYSTLLLVILVMGVYLYNISIKNVGNEIRTQNKLTLEKTIHDLDSSFTTMDLFASQVVTNSDIVHLANAADNESDDFYMKAYHAKEALSIYVFTESILPIKNYFIHLQQPGYIISHRQFTETELFYSGLRSFKKEKYEDWLNILSSMNLHRKFIPIDSFKNYIDSTYLYILPLDEYTLKNVPATISFEMNFDRLEANFQDLKFYDTGYLCVTDSEGSIIFTVTGDDAADIHVERLTNLDYVNGFSKYGSTENGMYVTKASSDYNHWNYYLVQPIGPSLYSLNQYRNIFIVIGLSALFFELIMILFLSRSNVRKITQMGNELQDTISEQRSLQKIVDRQKPIIMQSYLAKIMRGNISTDEELNYARQYLNITSENKKFSVLYMVAYVNQYELYVENSVVTGPDSIDYKDIILDAIDRFFDGQAFVLATSEKEYTILLSSPDEESSDESTSNVRNAFSALHEHLKDTHSVWTFAGLGDWNPGLMVTWKSYQQASQAISYATKRDTFRCYGNVERDTKTFYYPIELTNHLTTFITSGNSSQVLEIFETIRHENMEVRSLPITMMKYLLSDIRNTLYKIRFSLKTTEENEEDLKSIDTMFEQHMSLKLCEDLAISLCSLFETKTSGNKVIANIKEYIDRNYRDPSLCLNKISDEFSISESYFSFLFKDETGENFSSYLSRIRINRAMQMLKETDINISDIYQEVGFNNAHTFRRTFKKLHGISPKEARTQAKNA